MTKIPLKWKKVGNEGKVEINGEDSSAFTSESPALKVNGEVSASVFRGDLVGNVDTATYASSAGVADLAATASKANLLKYQHTNEINFCGGSRANCYINGRNADTDEATPISAINYRFCNYSNDTSKSTIVAASFSGNASSATVASTAAVASKLGSSNIGSASTPIYLNEGTPAACTSWLNGTISSIGLSSTVDYSMTGGSATSAACTNDTASYTYTKTSGTWNAGTVSAKRVANMVHMTISIVGTGTAVITGTAGFEGTIAAGTKAGLPALPVKFTTYYNAMPIICNIDTSGNVSFVPMGDINEISSRITIPNGTVVTASGTFICVS